MYQYSIYTIYSILVSICQIMFLITVLIKLITWASGYMPVKLEKDNIRTFHSHYM